MKFWSISPTLFEFYRHSLLERAGKHPVTWQQCQSADDFECSLYWFTFETKSYLKWIFRSTLHQNDDHFVWIQFNKGVKQNVCLSFKRRVFEVLLKQCTYLKSKQYSLKKNLKISMSIWGNKLLHILYCCPWQSYVILRFGRHSPLPNHFNSPLVERRMFNEKNVKISSIPAFGKKRLASNHQPPRPFLEVLISSCQPSGLLTDLIASSLLTFPYIFPPLGSLKCSLILPSPTLTFSPSLANPLYQFHSWLNLNNCPCCEASRLTPASLSI